MLFLIHDCSYTIRKFSFTSFSDELTSFKESRKRVVCNLSTGRSISLPGWLNAIQNHASRHYGYYYKNCVELPDFSRIILFQKQILYPYICDRYLYSLDFIGFINKVSFQPVLQPYFQNCF